MDYYAISWACMPVPRRQTFRWHHKHHMDALFARGWWVDKELEHLFGLKASSNASLSQRGTGHVGHDNIQLALTPLKSYGTIY